jgi:hypothetical protein
MAMAAFRRRCSGGPWRLAQLGRELEPQEELLQADYLQSDREVFLPELQGPARAGRVRAGVGHEAIVAGGPGDGNAADLAGRPAAGSPDIGEMPAQARRFM